MDHLGVEVFSIAEITAATRRLIEDDTECCYALPDKVWVQGPGKEPWEVYVVRATPQPRQGHRQRMLPRHPGRHRQGPREQHIWYGLLLLATA